jgi:hypothetical protein
VFDFCYSTQLELCEKISVPKLFFSTSIDNLTDFFHVCMSRISKNLALVLTLNGALAHRAFSPSMIFGGACQA